MATLPLGTDVFNRPFAKGAQVRVVNRFFEQNPTNQIEGSSLLARPGTKFFGAFGSGVIRSLFTQAGAFGGDLFIVSGTELFRTDGTTTTPITGVVSANGNPSLAVMANQTLGFEFLFIADGVSLQFYEGVSFARGTLRSTGAIVATDTASIGNVFYQWTSGDVNAGTPLGTMANPYLVALGTNNTAAFTNFKNALNFAGNPGVDYSSAITVQHTTIEGEASDDNQIDVKARARGVGGNSIAVTETGANLAWDNPTLQGGGAHQLRGVAVPDDLGIVSVASITGFIIAVVSNSQKFFWLNPGETTIAALNFASAESEPDEIISVMTVGDEVWFFGQSTTESWFPSGDPAAPFQRTQGRAFSRGTIEGTPVRVKEQIILVGNDGIVYSVAGGGPRRISTNTIEEQIRLALKAEREAV